MRTRIDGRPRAAAAVFLLALLAATPTAKADDGPFGLHYPTSDEIVQEARETCLRCIFQAVADGIAKGLSLVAYGVFLPLGLLGNVIIAGLGAVGSVFDALGRSLYAFAFSLGATVTTAFVAVVRPVEIALEGSALGPAAPLIGSVLYAGLLLFVATVASLLWRAVAGGT